MCTQLNAPCSFCIFMWPPLAPCSGRSPLCGCVSHLGSTPCAVLLQVLSDAGASPPGPGAIGGRHASSPGSTVTGMSAEGPVNRGTSALFWVFTGDGEGAGRKEVTQADLSLLFICNYVRRSFKSPRPAVSESWPVTQCAARPCPAIPVTPVSSPFFHHSCRNLARARGGAE